MSTLTTANRTPAEASADAYTARHLTVLEGLDAVRKRPGMYVGSTDSRGLHHCLWEIFDNAVDEALGGYCSRIEVILHADGSAEVRDNGRGIPVDVERKTKLSGVELVMTRLHAGGKFGGGSYTASGGLHGVGASVVNALAARLDVEVDRDGHTWAASFRRGVTGEFAGAGPDADFTKKAGLRQAGRVARKAQGTRIRFWPDRQVFLRDARFSFDVVTERARQTAYLVPGLTIVIREGTTAILDAETTERQAEFRFAGGISEFCAHLTSGDALTDGIRLTGSGNFTETIPVLDDRGHMTPTEVERELDVDVAVQWGTGYDTVVRSFVNVIATPHGGTHVTGFERALVRTLNEQLRAVRMLKNGNDVTKEDVLEGLVAVVSVRLPEPQFEGQTKEVLGTPAAQRIVGQVVSAQLKSYFESPPRGAKQQARSVLEKVLAAAQARIAAREHRDNQRRKSALASSSLPAKLVDCRSADDRSELFIVEGDSALGTAKLARNSEFQALLPIRGKILNVQKASLADMLKNAECAAIIQVIGAGSGSSFDLDSARYQRVVLMSVAPDEPILLTDRDGRFALRRIGVAIDEVINSGDPAWIGETVSVDLADRTTRISPLKQLIRHHHRGEMYRIKTAYGRSVTVTGGHSVFTYEYGELALKPASELRVGDLVVAPRRLPRPAPQHEVDLAGLLHRTGYDDAIRIEGEAVRRLLAAKTAARQPAHLRRDIPRIRLARSEWTRFAEMRKKQGITCADMAGKLGYRQACSISEFETCRSMPPEPVFRQYLAELRLPWPETAEVISSLVQQWSTTDSRNERYRSAASAAWLGELSEEDLSWLAAQEDGRDVVIYARAHRSDAISRFLPVSEHLCYMLGWYLAEGSVSSRGARLNFSLGADDDRYIPTLAAAIETVTGRPPVSASMRTDFPNSRHLYVHAPVFARMVKAMGMGGHAPRKQVPDLLLNCDEDKQLAFLEGYFLGDGSKDRSGAKLTFGTSSIDIANGLLYLMGQLGVLAGLSRQRGGRSTIRGREVKTRPGYIVNVTGKEALGRLRRLWRAAPCAGAYEAYIARAATRRGCDPISQDLVALPIRAIRKLHYDGDVYDLSVPEDENFISGTGGLLTHNSDADVDGAHIRTLLLTLFHRYLRPMLQAGRVFAAVPPLHRIELVNPRKGQEKYRYTYSDAELNRTLLELERRGQRWKEPVQRYKGLGEMDAAQLAETTMDPRHRTLRRIRIEDAAPAAEIFSLLMGTEVAPRRDFIVSGAAELDPSRIDT